MSEVKILKRPASKFIVLDSDDEPMDVSTSQTLTKVSSSQPKGPSPSPLTSSPAPPNPLKRKVSSQKPILSINDALMAKKSVPKVQPAAQEKRHSSSRHSVKPIVACREELLRWYDRVKGTRGMPWRKDYDASLSRDAKMQRAYEVLVSEIMLQQTQIATVIPYYNKWMTSFPTVRDLAAADIESINSHWKGLGYYSRGARLLQCAQKVVKDLSGSFPSTSAKMEASLPGVGRYTAGAVCSIVWSEQTPAVDGNVLRLFSRLLALHAPLKAGVKESKEPIEMVWRAAGEMVNGCEDAGALNQALIELGSTVCKPTNPSCGECPLNKGCAAYLLQSSPPPVPMTDIEDICTTCLPFPSPPTNSVTRFPMKVEKKKAREESCAVNVISWTSSLDETWVIVIRRPDTGLLANLYEFPTLPLQLEDGETVPTKEMLDDAAKKLLKTYLVSGSDDGLTKKSSDAGSLLHIFSHIRMTYQIRTVKLSSDSSTPPDVRQISESEVAKLVPGAGADEGDDEASGGSDDDSGAKPAKKKRKTAAKGKKGPSSKTESVLPRVRWVRASEVEDENISTGALKIWKQSQGSSSTSTKSAKGKKKT